MPYRTKWEERGIVWEFYGRVTGAEIDEANSEFIRDPRREAARYQIIDASGVTGTDWNARDAHVIAAKDFTTNRMTRNLRLAFVASDPDFVALVDEYIEISRNLETSWTFARFDDLPAARDWIERGD